MISSNLTTIVLGTNAVFIVEARQLFDSFWDMSFIFQKEGSLKCGSICPLQNLYILTGILAHVRGDAVGLDVVGGFDFEGLDACLLIDFSIWINTCPRAYVCM